MTAIQGAIVLPTFPAVREVGAAARLCPEVTETFVHPRKIAELEQRISKPLPYAGGGRYPMYTLGFMFPGGALFSAEHGFAVPEDWPFADEDVRLGSNITEQVALTVTQSGVLTVTRRGG